MNTELPILTTTLWNAEEKKDKGREINAALRKELKCQAMLKANEEVEAALDAEDGDQPSEKMLDIIRKDVWKICDKQLVNLKRQARKNSSGEDKNQTSKPGKNGQESKSNSKKSKKNPKKDTTTGKSKKQQQKTNSTNPSSNQRPPKQRGSAGGSSGGGKQRGAERR